MSDILKIAVIVIVGWRTDGTGTYPKADPLTKWSTTQNVVWKTPLAKWSNATPIIVGDKLLVCAETDKLTCINLADGKVLWEKSTTLDDALTTEQQAEAKQQAGIYDEIQETLKPLNAELGKLNRERSAIRKKLKETPDDQALKAQADELKKMIGDVKKRMSPLRKTLGGLTKYRRPGANSVNGYSTQTPTSDGKNVYVVFGNGVVACFDLDGNRKWARFVEKTRIGHGHSASPLLVGDKLLVHFVNMVALDTKTGHTAWTAKSTAKFGSPVLAKVGNVQVVVTPSGDFIRVSDGEVLVKGQASLSYNAPIVRGDVAYFIQNGGKGVQLSVGEDGKIDANVLWTTEPKKDRYYGSPILHEGLIYAVTRKCQFSVIDAETGEVVYTKALSLGGQAYPSIAQAGKYIFVSSDSGTTAVIEPGRVYKEIARNKLETFRSSPIFKGSRMYVRTYKHVYCIGK